MVFSKQLHIFLTFCQRTLKLLETTINNKRNIIFIYFCNLFNYIGIMWSIRRCENINLKNWIWLIVEVKDKSFLYFITVSPSKFTKRRFGWRIENAVQNLSNVSLFTFIYSVNLQTTIITYEAFVTCLLWLSHKRLRFLSFAEMTFPINTAWLTCFVNICGSFRNFPFFWNLILKCFSST